MVSDRACVFHIHVPWRKALSLVPNLRSYVKKIKYQGHSFRKNGRCEGIDVSQTCLVFVSMIECFVRKKQVFI